VWDNVGTFVTALIYIAILYVLVNPASPGPAAITAMTGALSNVVSAATGGGTLTSTGSTGGGESPPASTTASTQTG
jgi:hypothetical protein